MEASRAHPGRRTGIPTKNSRNNFPFPQKPPHSQETKFVCDDITDQCSIVPDSTSAVSCRSGSGGSDGEVHRCFPRVLQIANLQLCVTQAPTARGTRRPTEVVRTMWNTTADATRAFQGGQCSILKRFHFHSPSSH